MPEAVTDVATEPEPAGPPGWRAHLLPLTAVLGLGLAAYANAYGGAFVFDDLAQVRDSTLARDLSSWLPGGPGWRLEATRAVGYLSFALNHRLGASPGGYHAVNVAIHLANAFLVYALVVLALRAPRARGSWLAPHARAVAYVAAALFVTHPLQTQAVTYVVQRLTSLATLFYLAATVLYLDGRLAPPGRGRLRAAASYAGLLACALLAMLTKEIAFTLPFAIVLLELALFDREGRRWAALAPVLATALVIPVALATRTSLPAALSGAITGTRLERPPPRLDYLLTQPSVVVAYLRLLVLPAGQNLDHDVPIRHALLDPAVLSSAAVLAALAALAAVLLARTRPAARRPVNPAARLVAVGILWGFLALSVESLVPIVDVMNEHRVYLPSAGLFMAAAVALAFLARRASGEGRAAWNLAAAGTVIALVLAGATLVRNTVWRSDLTLWRDAASKSPRKLRPVENYGTALISAGHPDRAVPVLRHALELDGGSAYAHAQLAMALLSTGRAAEAEPELREALRLEPRDPEALFNLATLLWQTGRRDEARGWYARFVDAAGDGYVAARRLAATRAAPTPGATP